MKTLLFSKSLLILFVFFLFISQDLRAQEKLPEDISSFKQRVLELETNHKTLDLRLKKSSNTLKVGILVATLGYAVTIAGGQLLGTNPQAGEVLLYTGGAIGLGGTLVLFKGFRQLSGP